MGYVIGVDIGTSSTKAVLFDTAGRQVARCAQRYGLSSPEPGAAEQDPDEILRATTQTVADVVVAARINPNQLLGVSFSAAMHTLLLVDEANRPLTPLYTWADNLSDRFSFIANAKAPQLYQRTGLPAHPMSPVIKLMWLRDQQPDLFSQAARVVAIKEYVLWHWCGQWVIDHGMASTTGLLNVRSLNWDAGALALAGISLPQQSDLVPALHPLAIRADQAKKMGLPPSIPVIVGASDGVLANLGVGAIAPGTAAITLGTSGAVRQVVKQPITDSDAQLFCYALTQDRWVMGGAVNNGGIALQWARDSLVPYSSSPDIFPDVSQNALDKPAQTSPEPTRSTYARMTAMAREISPGAEGLIFHPYLLGERAPLWDAQARASFFGLGRHHTQAHLVRAVMEGVLYNMHSVFSALEAAGGEVSLLRASGGFAHSTLWQQMLSDIFNREILVPKVIESSALGAAVLALVSLGEWPDFTPVEGCLEVAYKRHPIAENVKRYQKILPIYTALLEGFQSQYASLQQAISEEG